MNVFNNMMEGISQHSLTKANVLSEHDAEARPVYRTTAADHDKLESEASASRDARDDANNDAKSGGDTGSDARAAPGEQHRVGR